MATGVTKSPTIQVAVRIERLYETIDVEMIFLVTPRETDTYTAIWEVKLVNATIQENK